MVTLRVKATNFDVVLRPSLDEIVVDLARAENDLADLVSINQIRKLVRDNVQNTLARSKVLNVRDTVRRLEQGLGTQKNEGFPEHAVHLTT